MSGDCFITSLNFRMMGLQKAHHFERKICFEGGLAAMELLAMTMRAEGMLSCRSLSFKGLGGWQG